MTPYERRRAAGGSGAAGRASEKKLARKVGGQQTPGSGALEGAKGDVRLDDMLIEAKSTIHSSYSVKLATLTKIVNEARAANKQPALAITFTMPDGSPVRDGEFVCVPLRFFKEHLTRLAD